MEPNGKLARAARGQSVVVKMVIIGVLILVLLLRPQGLLGRKAVRAQ